MKKIPQTFPDAIEDNLFIGSIAETSSIRRIHNSDKTLANKLGGIIKNCITSLLEKAPTSKRKKTTISSSGEDVHNMYN